MKKVHPSFMGWLNLVPAKRGGSMLRRRRLIALLVGLLFTATAAYALQSDITRQPVGADTIVSPSPGIAAAVSNVQAVNITPTDVTFTWDTDVPTTSQAFIMIDNDSSNWRSPEQSELVTNHSVTMGGLSPNRRYWYYVASKNTNGTYTTSGRGQKSFTTAAIDTTIPFDYRLALSGPEHVTQGSNLYLAVGFTQLAGPGNPSAYFTDISGLPANTSYRVICNLYVKTGGDCGKQAGTNYPIYFHSTTFGAYPPDIEIITTPSTSTGQFTLSITTRVNGIDKTVTKQIFVDNLTPVAKQTITSVPPIPSLARWETTMQELGLKWCDLTQTMAFGYEPQVWYYDGARTYYQMADYTGDPFWYKCGDHILEQWRDVRVIPANGAVQAWRVFPHGLYMDYLRTGNDLDKQADLMLAHNSALNTTGGVVNPSYIRETAYLIQANVIAERLGDPKAALQDRSVDFALGMIDQLFVSSPEQFDQPFFDGILAAALIEYYDWSKDPRIPPALQTMADKMWDKSWDPVKKGFVYNSLDVPRTGVPDISMLTAPLYAWLWHQTGDPKYQIEGDQVFASAIATDFSYSGKVFNQNYRWGFDYVKWRTQVPLASDKTPPSLVDIQASTPNQGQIVVRWKTNKPSDSQVEYGPTDSYGKSSDHQNYMITSHQVMIGDLPLNSSTHFRVKSTDASSNKAVSADYSLAPISSDIQGPAIWNITPKFVPTTYNPTITWQTDEPADTTLEYGPTTTLGKTVAPASGSWNARLSTYHTVAMNDDGTIIYRKFYYRVKSKDASGNETVSPIMTFKSSGQTLGKSNQPTISLLSINQGAPISGPVSLTANVSGQGSWLGVQFLVDGVNLGEELGASPYVLNWDTTRTSSGVHNITAVVRDENGSTATSEAISVTVTNPGGTIIPLAPTPTAQPTSAPLPVPTLIPIPTPTPTPTPEPTPTPTLTAVPIALSPSEGAPTPTPAPTATTVSTGNGNGNGNKNTTAPGQVKKEAGVVTQVVTSVQNVFSAVLPPTPAAPAVTTPSGETQLTAPLQLRNQGESVRKVHELLSDLGYGVNPSATRYTYTTRAAVRRFQLANGLSRRSDEYRQGVIGSVTLVKLNAELDRMWAMKQAKPVTVIPLDLRLGQSGYSVIALEKTLNQLGQQLPESVRFNYRTRSGLIQFQRAEGLKRTGRVDQPTLDRLRQKVLGG